MDSIAQNDKMLPNKTLPNKTMLRIDQTDSGVSVNFEDGTSYHGDVVVGCDDVNSKASTRIEMCRLASEKNPDHFRVMKETRMSAEFNCLFGISDPVDGDRAKIAGIFNIPFSDIDVELPMLRYGVDSLVAVELRNWLSSGAKAKVTVFDILQSASLNEFGALVASRSEDLISRDLPA